MCDILLTSCDGNFHSLDAPSENVCKHPYDKHVTLTINPYMRDTCLLSVRLHGTTFNTETDKWGLPCLLNNVLY